MKESIEIIFADDHEIFSDGFTLIFKAHPEITLTGVARDGQELVTLAHHLKPDVILTDIKMPVMDGIEATRILKHQLPHIGVIALSMYEGDSAMIGMMEAGAMGYLAKNASKTEVLEAIKSIYEGDNYFCKKSIDRFERLNANGKIRSDCSGYLKNELTKKEKEVVHYVCNGFSNKQIASEMNISKRTIEWHRRTILEKTGANNAAGIVTYAIKNQLFDY